MKCAIRSTSFTSQLKIVNPRGASSSSIDGSQNFCHHPGQCRPLRKEAQADTSLLRRPPIQGFPTNPPRETVYAKHPQLVGTPKNLRQENQLNPPLPPPPWRIRWGGPEKNIPGMNTLVSKKTLMSVRGPWRRLPRYQGSDRFSERTYFLDFDR